MISANSFTCEWANKAESQDANSLNIIRQSVLVSVFMITFSTNEFVRLIIQPCDFIALAMWLE